MSGRESWNFLNLLPDIIKEKISDMGLSEKEVNEIIKIWNNQISNKNTQIETEIVKNIKDLISQDF